MADRSIKVLICILGLLFMAGFILLSQEEAANDNPAQEQVRKPVPETVPAPSQAQIQEEIKNDADRYEIELSAEEIEADTLVKQAREAFQSDDFEKAVNTYISAKKVLEKIGGASNPRLIRKINGIDEVISIVYHYWAEDIASKADEAANAEQFDKAIEYCNKAKEVSPSSTARMDNLIERYSELKKAVKFRNETSDDYLLPNRNDKEYNIDVLFEQGKKFYDDGQYDKARDKFEELLVINPYHVKAIRYIRLLNEKMFDAGTIRFQNTLKERLTEAVWEFVSPVLPRTFTGEKEILQAPVEKKEGLSDIQKKLDKIIIDHMEFEEVSIPVVVKYLKTRSKELDPEGEGVNIFLRLSSASPAAPETAPAEGEAAPAEGEAEPAAEGEAEPAEEGVVELMAEEAATQNITILVDDIPLIEAIKYICRAANLKYRIEKYAVVIAAQDVPLDELETRIYPVEQETFADLGAEGDGGGDAAGDGGGTTSAQNFFSLRGVSFPEGSRVVYDSSISRLIATNTPDNLEKIEKIIKELNVTDPQVLIEAKFVEIAENAMNSLGIEWSIGKPRADFMPASAMTFNANDPLERFSDDVSPVFSNNKDVILSVDHGTDSGVQYSALLHALNVSDTTDILSTPRITTQNGEEATIRMITEVYLPESWSEATYIPGPPDIFTPSVPSFSEATEIGVRLTVTPTVDADRYTIALDMVPVVQALYGWIDYSYDVPSTSGGTYTNTLRMPIIEARTITTQLTIYDGETVVMGGVTKNTTGNINDQIPFLGTVPLIGRLFQSQVEDNAKRNLLIFTTVRLVQPDGSPYRAREIRGLPPFRQ